MEGRLEPTLAPSPVIHHAANPFGGGERSRQVAEMLDARHATLDDVGHGWSLEDPRAAADLIKEFHALLRSALCLSSGQGAGPIPASGPVRPLPVQITTPSAG